MWDGHIAGEKRRSTANFHALAGLTVPSMRPCLPLYLNNRRWPSAAKIVTSRPLYYLLPISIVVIRFQLEIICIDVLDHFGNLFPGDLLYSVKTSI